MIIIVAVCLPLMIAAVALAVDLGSMRHARAQAQSAADAAALAGAQDLYANDAATATATTDANTYVAKNDPGARNTVTTGYNSDPSAVQVTVSQTVPLSFAGLFGGNSGSVSASATAGSDLTPPLGYFGDGYDSDLNDGSQTGDGWTNFCADDTYADPYDTGNPTGAPTYKSSTDHDYGHTSPETGFYQASDNGTDSASPPDPSSPDYSTYPSDDPGRCPPGADANQHALDGWTVVHGGVDVSGTQFPSPPGTTDQMVDLTGTCVEAGPKGWPNGKGSTTITQEQGKGHAYDGYCENNADGEIENGIPTIKGQTYTVNFQMTQNDGGAPYTKQMLVLISDTDLADLVPAADTNGNDSEGASGTAQYATTYPLESSTNRSEWNGLKAHIEYTYNGPASNTTWFPESFTFVADQTTTYLGFASLDNCIPDWDTTTEAAAASTATVTSSTSFTQPTDTVNALNGSNECFFGPALSDVTVTGASTPVALTQ